MALLTSGDGLFLHIPKTGGRFVTQVLEDLGAVDRNVGHIHADSGSVRPLLSRAPAMNLAATRLKSHVPLRIKQRTRALNVPALGAAPTSSRFTFCFVREPAAWYESFWRYMVDRSGGDWTGERDLQGWHPCAPLAPLGSDDFPTFMERVVEREPGFVTQMYGRYTADGIDYVGRQESLVEDLIEVLDRLGLKHDGPALRQLARVNASTNRAIEWPNALRDEVDRLEYAAAVRYGYKK